MIGAHLASSSLMNCAVRSGVVSGVGTAEGLGRFTDFATIVKPYSIVLALGFSAAVGIFFGYYPATRAAKLDPIECLRYE